MPALQYQNYGNFYPNRSSVDEVRVGGMTVKVTNDLWAHDHEIRHFMDLEFLQETRDGQALFESMVDPDPACLGLWGAKTDQPLPVKGMLSQALVAKYKYNDNSGMQQKMELHLSKVLVVEGLPVPLHISKKALMRAWPSDVPKPDPFFSITPRRPFVFEAESFPLRYRTRPFWTSNVIYLGGSGSAMEPQAFQAAAGWLAAHQGDDSASVPRCAACGATGQGLSRCAGCRAVRYCGPECQRSDWRRHKASCRAAQQQA